MLAQVFEKLMAKASDYVGVDGLSPELMAQLDALKARLAQDIPNLDELKAELRAKADAQLEDVKGKVQGELDKLKDQGKSELEKLKDGVLGQAPDLDSLKDVSEQLTGEYKDKLDDLLGDVGADGSIADSTKEQITDLLNEVKDEVKLPEGTKEAVQEALDSLKEGGAPATEEIKSKLDEAKKGLGGLLGGKKKDG
ncbi:MAG: hypothetical protein R3F34_02295 [Planctomycetota bacterium]